MFYKKEDVKKLGTILCVWAHPDDESFTSAGLLSVAVENNQRVAVITATKGELGTSRDVKKWPVQKISDIRAKELDRSLSIIGVKEHYWLGFHDGKLSVSNQESAIEKISELIRKINPDTIITFSEQGLTGHIDHKTIHRWVVFAIKNTNTSAKLLCAVDNKEYVDIVGKYLEEKFNYYYFDDIYSDAVDSIDADICITLEEETMIKKKLCIQSHESQTRDLFSGEQGKIALKKLCECECFMYKKVLTN